MYRLFPNDEKLERGDLEVEADFAGGPESLASGRVIQLPRSDMRSLDGAKRKSTA